MSYIWEKIKLIYYVGMNGIIEKIRIIKAYLS